ARPLDRPLRPSCGDGARRARPRARARHRRADRAVPPRRAGMSAAETARLRDRVDELERLLGMRPVLPRIWGLTPREADVFGILLKRQVMSHTQLFEAIWGGDSDRETKIVEVMICKLRAKLRPYGIAIRTEHGVGYFIPPDSKAAARALIDAHAGECP